MIPYSRQSIDKEDIKKVIEVLKSDFLTQGHLVPKFEKKLKQSLSVKFAIVMSNATSALHVACLSLGLKQNDIVWTVPNTFIATANCAQYCGAKVDFVDIDYETGNISIVKLKEKLINAKKKNRLPKILIPVHFAGHPTEQEKIWKLSKKYGFKIIEDASHALGAFHKNVKVGNCKWSDIAVFSFHPVKIITSAEGGAITTNSKKIYKKIKMLHLHGTIKKEFIYKKQYSSFSQQFLGYNYRMNDLQAALGINQLSKLNLFIKKRNILAKKYHKLFNQTNVDFIRHLNGDISSFHLFVIRPKNQSLEYSNFEAIKYFRKKGLGVTCHYFPVHLQPYYRKIGFKHCDFPNSEKHSKFSLSIPLFFNLSFKTQEAIADIIIKYFAKFEK